MKTDKQIVESALQREVLKAKAGHFVCKRCLTEKKNKDKSTAGNICRTCQSRLRILRYRVSKTPLQCSQCKVTSTNFSGVGLVCRTCKNLNRKERKKRLRKNLGEKLLILWKSGYDFERAIEKIKFKFTPTK